MDINRKTRMSLGTVGASMEDSNSFQSKTGSMRSMHSRRRTEMIKVQRIMQNMPQRKLLFRPKVYDWWKDGEFHDDDEENKKLLKDIAEKEKKLMGKRKKSEEEDEFSLSDGEGHIVKTLEKLKSRKQRENEYRQKLEDEKRKKEEDEIQELEEKLRSEMQNPSMYGWFFTDGYYDNAPYFGIRQDLVEKFQDQQEKWTENWNKKYPETFTEQFKRFFWPPKYCCGKRSFRTRGSYLDFPEIIADWPPAVEVNFEREPREYITNRHELFGVDERQQEEDELAEAQARAEEEEQRKLAEAEAKMAQILLEEEENRKKELKKKKKKKGGLGAPSDEEQGPYDKKYGIHYDRPFVPYDKPWIEKATLRNPDTIKKEREKEKARQQKDREDKYKKFHWLVHGVSRVNPEEQSEQELQLKKQTLSERRKQWVKKF